MQTTAGVMESSSETPARPGTKVKSAAPVLVLGCDRSGTKLLYHMLLSSGGFAIYYSESNAFNLLGLRFGNLKRRRNRQRLMEVWLQSKLFYRSGLSREEVEPRVLADCRNAGDFLRVLMEAIARKQGKQRWAEATPQHLHYLPLIKKLIPDALVIHIIRDGRDVALSLDKAGWIRPFPWGRERSLLAAGLYWKWMVTKGLKFGRAMGADYLEVHYEDLVRQPRETLARVGAFIGHDLDYDRIQRVGLGSVSDPNSSFKSDDRHKELNPVGRWAKLLPPERVALLEQAIGPLLRELDYDLATPAGASTAGLSVRIMKALYPALLESKLWLKSSTPLRRFARLGRMAIGER
ncbi:MAG TPA: sulfotransferase [Terriglobia bacterium]|nr:sulfotransferase [Terriglobia bacterium]